VHPFVQIDLVESSEQKCLYRNLYNARALWLKIFRFTSGVMSVPFMNTFMAAISL
jgi:hypothetical protein